MGELSALQTVATTIAASDNLSSPIHLRGWALVGISMPAGWDTADLTFQASAGVEGASYSDLYDDTGLEYTVTAAAGQHLIVPAGDFSGVQWLKIRSGTSGTPVTQSAARTLTLVFRPVF